MKKLLTLLLTVLFCLTSVLPGFAAGLKPQTAPEKMVVMEKFLYGTEQAGALMTRVDSIETDVYGVKTSDPILTRVDNIYSYLFGVKGSGSLRRQCQNHLLRHVWKESKICCMARLKHKPAWQHVWKI